MNDTAPSPSPRRPDKSTLAAVVLATVGLLWLVGDVLLVVFAGILLAVFLRGLSDILAHLSGAPAGWALAGAILSLTAALALIGWLLGADIVSQLDQLVPRLQKFWTQLQDGLHRYEWGRALLAKTSAKAVAQGDAEWLARLTGGIFSNTFEVVASLLVIVFIGLYGAVAPHTYVEGLLQLIPGRNRGRAAEVLAAVASTLRWWLIGTFVRMLMLGVATSLGLMALGMPLALALGLIAFVFDFVPYLGAILAATPAMLVALTIGPAETAYVGLLYLAIHAAENYLVAPLVDQRSVRLPPALAISAQLLLGSTSLGLLGVMFATPLTAVGIVLVKMLYIEDYLGERTAVKDGPTARL